MNQRSKGVTILAVLLVLTNLSGLLLIVTHPSYTTQWGAIVNVLAYFVTIVFGVGLFLLKEWARIGTICIEALQAFLTIISIPKIASYQGQTANRILEREYSNLSPLMKQRLAEQMQSHLTIPYALSIIGVIIWIAIIIYFLTRPSVKEQFNN